jgi:acyl-CoA thioester hydrolase
VTARFEWPVRVYWEDTDAGGVVYHAAYLAFLERARSEWLRALGIDQGALRDTERLQFSVVEMSLRWLKSARYGDLLTVTASVARRGGASIDFVQTVQRGAETLVEARVRVAAVDAGSLRPRRLPPSVAALA